MKTFLSSTFGKINKEYLKEKLLGGNATHKIVIAYIILVLIPISFVMYFYYRQSVSIAMDEVAQVKYESLTQSAVHISYRLETIREISNNIFGDRTLNELVSAPVNNRSLSYQLDEYERISSIINNYQGNEDVFRIRLFIKKDKSYANEVFNFFPYSDLENLPWYDEIKIRAGASFWKNTYRHRYSGSSDYENIITCARLMKNLKHYDEIIGGVLIDIRENTVYDILNNSASPNKEKLLIIDRNGIIVAHSDKSLIGTNYLTNNMIEGISYLNEGVNRFHDKYLICKDIELVDWKIIAETSVDEIFMQGKTYRNFIDVLVLVIVFIMFMIAFFAIFWFLVLRMSRRIKKIIRKIEVDGIESLEMNSLANGEDIHKLESGIDSMIQNVKKLMDEAYQARMEKTESEIRILQAQINPHFLYNTLDNISWLAVKDNAKDVGTMIQLLSKYFRLSLHYGRDIVSIKDEINLAQVYIDMQNSRFLNIISADFDVDDCVLQYNIPKLTLQPIIENAVLHGLQRKSDKDWRISISAKMIGSDIVFTVVDNGVGIEADVFEILLEKENDGKERFSYGLYNVNKRIKLFFGDDYGVDIASAIGKGTVVTVTIKAVLKE